MSESEIEQAALDLLEITDRASRGRALASLLESWGGAQNYWARSAIEQVKARMRLEIINRQVKEKYGE